MSDNRIMYHYNHVFVFRKGCDKIFEKTGDNSRNAFRKPAAIELKSSMAAEKVLV